MCANIDLNIFISVGVRSNPLPSYHRSFSVTLSHRIIGHFRTPADLDRLLLNYHSGCGDVSTGLRTGSAIIISEKLDQKYKQGQAHNMKKQSAGYSKLSLALCHRHTLWVFSSESHSCTAHHCWLGQASPVWALVHMQTLWQWAESRQQLLWINDCAVARGHSKTQGNEPC